MAFDNVDQFVAACQAATESGSRFGDCGLNKADDADFGRRYAMHYLGRRAGYVYAAYRFFSAQKFQVRLELRVEEGVEITPELVIRLLAAGVSFADITSEKLDRIQQLGIEPGRWLQVVAMSNIANDRAKASGHEELQKRLFDEIQRTDQARSAEELEGIAQALERISRELD